MTSVCFVNMPIEYYSPTSGGAIATIIREVTTALQASGHDVRVLSRTDGGPVHAAGRFVDLGPMPELRGTRRLADRLSRRLLAREHVGYEQYRRAVRRALRSSRPAPDIVVVFNDYVSPSWLRRTAPGATVVNWLQNDQPLPRRRPSVSGPVLCCSDYVRGRAIERGVPAAAVHTAVSGVDSETFHPSEEWLERARPVRVLTIGRLDPNKGHDAALEAVRSEQERGAAVTATLAGAKWWYGDQTPDEHTTALLAAVTEVDGTFAGLVSREDVPALFRRHDVCMVLSRAQEPFGLVALEAMASGCAVIASDRGGLPQACGGAAELVDPDDPVTVHRALSRLTQDDAALAEAKRRARDRAVRAPWSHAAEVLLSQRPAVTGP